MLADSNYAPLALKFGSQRRFPEGTPIKRQDSQGQGWAKEEDKVSGDGLTWSIPTNAHFGAQNQPVCVAIRATQEFSTDLHLSLTLWVQGNSSPLDEDGTVPLEVIVLDLWVVLPGTPLTDYV